MINRPLLPCPFCGSVGNAARVEGTGDSAAPAAPSEADREWVRHLQSAFADPHEGVVLPQEYFARLCDIALAATTAPDPVREIIDAAVGAAIERERAGREADTRDAERYRWLRQYAGRSQDFPLLDEPNTPEEMDTTIDAARSEGRDGGEG